MSQQEFAQELGVSASTVSRWERGQTVPSQLARSRMARLGKHGTDSSWPPRENSWWAAEVERLRPAFVRFVEQRLPTSSAEDAVGDVIREVVEGFREHAAEYPASWFERARPQDSEVHAFRALLWKVMRRRTYDELRRSYVRAREDARMEAESEGAAIPAAEDVIDAKRFLACLARHIEDLPVSDRDLIGRGVEDRDNRSSPLSGKERVRLYRLRRKLAALVRDDLGIPRRRGQSSDEGGTKE